MSIPGSSIPGSSIPGYKRTLFLLLWLVGFVGECATLWLELPIPEGVVLPLPIPVLKLVSLAQALVILTLSVWAGVALASRVGLSAPFFEAIAANLTVSSDGSAASPLKALKKQIPAGIIAGIVGVSLSTGWFLLMRGALPDDFLSASAATTIPLWVRLLKGGIAEEIVLRWGVMTVLVWLLWRFLQRRRGQPHGAYVTASILLSAVVFGLLHLPAVSLLTADVTGVLAFYIVVGNALFGIVAGYLYWQVGLESAIAAHMIFHIVLVGAESFV
ncbi:MAG: CPBP family intramembrane glutamic endopeptidase [Cyanobacteria bacterium J06621_3]